MDYEKLYKDALGKAKTIYQGSYKPDIAATIAETLQNVFPELVESEDDKIRKELTEFLKNASEGHLDIFTSYKTFGKWLTWFEKQELKSNPYSGVSFSYNGNIWGMCARDNGVDILFNKTFIEHISNEKQREQKSIMNIPSREVILSIWDLGNEWKELTCGCISTEYGTQLDYIQKHWYESEYYLRETQGKQETLCDKCRKEQPSHSCQDITELGRCAVEAVKYEQKSDLNKEENIDNGNKADDFVFELDFDFNVGQWIVVPIAKKVFLITKIEGFSITLVDIDGDEYVFGVDSLKHARLWTINDAEKGDILVAPKIDGSEHSEQIFIFKEIKDRDYAKNAVEYYCRVVDGEFYVNEQGFMGQSDDNFVPAIKEQRDTLMNAIADAGWTFDFEKKELK